MCAATLKMIEISTKATNGASTQASGGFFTPNMTSSGLISFPTGPASKAPIRMPTKENATRMTPCRYPIPASDASSNKARSQNIIYCN